MRYLITISLLLVLNACIVQRTIVRQPNLSLHILDSSQNPVSNAKMYVYWWSNPYSRLQESYEFLTDASGFIKTNEILQTDTAYPFMLHGVQEYHHSLCIEMPDYRTLLMTLNVLPGEKVKLELPLTLGESIPVCGDFETMYGHAGTPRPDIPSQHPSVQAAYEVTEQ
jgi:hypothetical protein